MNYDYQDLDKVIQIAVINLYSLSKQDGEIKLLNFNRKNKAHMGFLHAAFILSKMYDFNINLHIPFIDFLILKFKVRKNTKIYRISQKEYDLMPKTELLNSTDGLIYDIVLANDYSSDIFAEAYERYFK